MAVRYLNEASKRHAQLKNTPIQLRDHQLAMLESARASEKQEHAIRVMADPPGAGKTYVLLALIRDYTPKNQTNIVVVPQNIYSQWVQSIEALSGIEYRSFMNYSEITSLYFDNQLKNKNAGLLLTTPLYFNIISDSLEAAKINVKRVIVDEIDSVSNLLKKNIGCETLWLVSGSFDMRCLEGTPYDGQVPIVTQTTADFVRAGFPLQSPERTRIQCQNFYIGLLDGLISSEQMNQVNGLDFSMFNARVNLNEQSQPQPRTRTSRTSRTSGTTPGSGSGADTNCLSSKDVLNFFVNDLKEKQVLLETAHKDLEKGIEKAVFHRGLFEGVWPYVDQLRSNLIEDIAKMAPSAHLQGTLVLLDRYGISDVNKLLEQHQIENAYNLKHRLPEVPRPFVDLDDFKKTALLLATSNVMEQSLRHQLANSREELAKIQRTYETLCQRITDAQTCLICYEPFTSNTVKSVSHCCKNTFCHECIATWMGGYGRNTCPMCRAPHFKILGVRSEAQELAAKEAREAAEAAEAALKAEKLAKEKQEREDEERALAQALALSIAALEQEQEMLNEQRKIDEENLKTIKNNQENQESQESQESQVVTGFEGLDKLCVLSRLFDTSMLGDKVIIFNNYPTVFKEIQRILEERHVTWTVLDGGNIKELDKSLVAYKSTTRVLLTNSSFYGCGMNLENTSDIILMHRCNAQRMTDKGMEEQIIGRAQRPGRTCRLKVFELLHANELDEPSLYLPLSMVI